MQFGRFLSTLVAIALFQNISVAQSQTVKRTVINNSVAAKQLLGKHKLTLQWISFDNWEEFGNLRVFDRQGTLFVKGRQIKGDDYLEIAGKVLSIDAKEFVFQGRITTRVSHINRGQACERNGTMTFAITENRKYWRLQEMNSPCDPATDYVDIFMR